MSVLPLPPFLILFSRPPFIPSLPPSLCLSLSVSAPLCLSLSVCLCLSVSPPPSLPHLSFSPSHSLSCLSPLPLLPLLVSPRYQLYNLKCSQKAVMMRSQRFLTRTRLVANMWWVSLDACTPHVLLLKIRVPPYFRTYRAFFPTPLPANHGPHVVLVVWLLWAPASFFSVSNFYWQILSYNGVSIEHTFCVIVDKKACSIPMLLCSKIHKSMWTLGNILRELKWSGLNQFCVSRKL